MGLALGALFLWLVHDVVQRRHAIIRNFPIVGHFRYWLEAIGPELRQYIVTGNDEERPFSRDQRRWVYASSKRQNNYFGFGTDNDLESDNLVILRHATFAEPAARTTSCAWDPTTELPAMKILGGARQRRKAFRPASVVNVSAMSFGSLSANAIEAINRGASIAGCMHNTGEGGVSEYHRQGGDLIWQIGTGYFGCRKLDGTFCRDGFRATLEKTPTIRAIEIKLSQGAKPGMGGLLPAAKITPEIAAIRGIPLGQDCHSPSRHSSFHDVDGMIDFVEELADRSGLPVGIKSAVGDLAFWRDLAERMEKEDRGVDFITIDGAEGGTGAAPLAFADHVALPFKLAFTEVYRIFAERGVQDRIFFFGSGRLGFPERALFAMALGCDAVHVAREAMLSIGCIQAQRCHTGHCPTGVATQNRWLMRGLDPTLKSARMANYVAELRAELLLMAEARGVVHPALVELDAFQLCRAVDSQSAAEHFGYQPGWGLPSPEQRAWLSGEIVSGAQEG